MEITKCRNKIRMDGSYSGSKNHLQYIIYLYYVFFAKVTFCEELRFRSIGPLFMVLCLSLVNFQHIWLYSYIATAHRFMISPMCCCKKFF